MAIRPVSNSNINPKKMKSVPNPSKPTPISTQLKLPFMNYALVFLLWTSVKNMLKLAVSPALDNRQVKIKVNDWKLLKFLSENYLKNFPFYFIGNISRLALTGVNKPYNTQFWLVYYINQSKVSICTKLYSPQAGPPTAHKIMTLPDFDTNEKTQYTDDNSSTVLQIPNAPPSPSPSQVEKLKMSPAALPSQLIQGRKLFKKTPWAMYMTIGFILTLILVIPGTLIYSMEMRKEVGKAFWHQRIGDNVSLGEAFRWSILSSFYVFFFFMFTAFFSTFPVAFKHSGEYLRTSGQVVGGLRFPLSFWLSATLTLLFFFNWQLNHGFETLPESVASSSISSLDQYVGRFPALLFETILGIFNLFVDLILSHRMLLLNIPTVLFTFSSMLLIEQSLMLYTSHAFHKNFYTKRIKENNLVLSAIEALNRKFPVEGSKPVKAGSVLEDEVSDKVAETIFRSLCKTGANSVVMDDLLVYLEHPTAVAVFDFLDSNQSGDLTLEEFKEAFRDAYETKRNLNKSIKANEEVLDKIDNFFITLLVGFKVVVVSEKLSGSVLGFLALFGSFLFAVKASFSDVFGVFTDSMTHFLLTHPYDIGDKVKIDHQIYRVKNINLWMTTLAEPSGRIVYATNSSMSDAMFGNYRRSDRQDEILSIVMNINVSKELLEQFISELDTYVKTHHRFFADRVVFKDCQVCNCDAMSVDLAFRHQGNFNNDEPYNLRRRMMFNQMRTVAKNLGIQVYSMRFKDWSEIKL